MRPLNDLYCWFCTVNLCSDWLWRQPHFQTVQEITWFCTVWVISCTVWLIADYHVNHPPWPSAKSPPFTLVVLPKILYIHKIIVVLLFNYLGRFTGHLLYKSTSFHYCQITHLKVSLIGASALKKEDQKSFINMVSPLYLWQHILSARMHSGGHICYKVNDMVHHT